MDIQAEKLNLIEWLAGIDDSQVIRQLKSLQLSNQQSVKLSDAEKTAIDQGLQSIKDGQVHSHESVMASTKKKFPNLFK